MKIFISHAYADRRLVGMFVNLLHLGMGVGEDEVFYSSQVGNIQNGDLFVQRILLELRRAKLTICIVSPSYLTSQFCIAEAGAALMQSTKGEAFDYLWPIPVFICMVPPIKPSDLTGIFLGRQVSDIFSRTTLAEIRARVREIRGSVNGDPTWETHLSSFVDSVCLNVSSETDLK
jgi:hypothetical protein